MLNKILALSSRASSYSTLRRFAMATLLVGCSTSFASAEAVRLMKVVAEPLQPRHNLSDNASFEQDGPDGIPDGWRWDRRNTDATCVIDTTDAHTGRQSIKLTNSTPQGTHVYGMLWRHAPITLIEGKTYTMSVWIKSDAPGRVRLIGGPKWRHKASAVITDGQWRCLSKTFTADSDDSNFIVRITTESPTAGVWIDNVKVEKGDEPSFGPIDASRTAAPLLGMDDPAWSVEGDGPFQISFVLGIPRAVAGQWNLRLSTGESLRQPANLAAGVWRIMIEGEAVSAPAAFQTLRVDLEENERQAATAQIPIRFYSPKTALKRIAILKEQWASLKKDLETVKSRQQDGSYPDVTLTVLENFIHYAEQDAQGSAVKRAFDQIDELEAMAKRLRVELDEALADKRQFPAVPRWTAEQRPIIQSSSFLSTVRYADGATAERPVFFTGFGHFGRCVADLEKWPHYGTNIIQIEIGPRDVFPAKDVTDETPIRRMRQILDRAQKSGVAVCLLVSQHYFPKWAMEEWPQLKKDNIGFLKYCLHAPEGQELLRRFLTKTIVPLKDHPALHSICLSNEPVNKERPCAPGKRLWQTWLQDRHESIENLNACYQKQYTQWSDVPLPDPYEKPSERALWMDYVRFNQEFFADWHKMLADAVHQIAPTLPVHTKAMSWTMLIGGNVQYGVDAELFGRFSDINGNDSANYYNYESTEFAQEWRLNAIIGDLQRSVLDAPVFNSENHIIVDRDLRYVPPSHIRSALWQAAIHGQSATTIWVWERTSNLKSDLSGSIMLRPACTEAVGLVNLDLNRAALEVTAIQQTPPQALILQSFTASTLETQSYDQAMDKLYTALTFTGLKLGFAAERQLEAGLVPETPLLLIPNIKHLSDAAWTSLQKYKGRLVFVGDGDPLSHDEYGRPRSVDMPIEKIAIDTQISARDLCEQIVARLPKWNVQPLVTLREADRPFAWGVACRSVETPEGTVVNLCNYQKEPATVTVTKAGQAASGHDVLSGKRLSGTITLQPLEVKLIRLER